MPKFKKSKGGFSKKFMKKSPFKGADTSLMSAVGSAEAETSEAGGKIIEAMGKSERSSQLIDNMQKAGLILLGIPPEVANTPEGEAGGYMDLIKKIGGGGSDAGGEGSDA